ncbi:MAG: vanomycin resistance protein VanB [Epulopiscium sp.]|nr:vanomycin resistance protein VanB [Candidatus Epulonipiscium sp.]
MDGDNLNIRPRKLVLFLKVLIVILLAIGVLVIGAYFYIRKVVCSYKDTICQGIWIENISVGGLTKEEAKEKLIKEVQKNEYNKKIVLFYEDKKWILPYNKWDGNYDYDEILHKAFSIGHTGSLIERYKDIRFNKNRLLFLSYTFDEETVYNQIEALAKEINKEPRNAILKRQNDRFQIENEVLGIEMDVESTAKKVIRLISEKREGVVEVIVNKTDPIYTKEILSKVKDLVGSFSTEFDLNNTERVNNLTVAAQKLNGQVINVDEVFSLNKVISPFTVEEGYTEAPAIVNGELVPDIGGGVCQIASTLYNAVLFADLEILERTNHSLPVSYVELGRDATIAGDQIDFKFKNTTSFPIYIESYVRGNKVYVNLYGCKEEESPYTIEFESVVVETTPPPEDKIVYDSTLEKGKEMVTVKPSEGKKVELYKKIYDNGQLISKTLVNTSYYRPRGAEIHIGTWENKVFISESEEL